MFKIYFFFFVVMIVVVLGLWLLISPFFTDIEKSAKRITKNLREEEIEDEI